MAITTFDDILYVICASIAHFIMFMFKQCHYITIKNGILQTTHGCNGCLDDSQRNSREYLNIIMFLKQWGNTDNKENTEEESHRSVLIQYF